MRQPEGDPRLEEEAVLKRLLEFRAGDTRDVTPLNFYDEIDIHPFVVHVTESDDYAMERAYRDVTLRMGSPSRYPKLMGERELEVVFRKNYYKQKRIIIISSLVKILRTYTKNF